MDSMNVGNHSVKWGQYLTVKIEDHPCFGVGISKILWNIMGKKHHESLKDHAQDLLHDVRAS